MEREIEKLLRGKEFVLLLEQQAAKIRERYGLKEVDISILYYLSKNPEHNTAKDIQNFFNINKGYISQIVDNLCKLKLVSALVDENDRRYIHYIVTEKTVDIVEEMHLMREKISSKIFQGVTEEEKQIFKNVAGKIEKNMKEMLKN